MSRKWRLFTAPRHLLSTTPHRYVAAAFASLVAFVFALLGIIHQPEIKFVDGAFMDGYHKLSWAATGVWTPFSS